MKERISEFQLEETESVLFHDAKFLADCQTDELKKEYLVFLSLCHSVVVDEGNFNATSPDELALVNFAKMCGVEFLGLDEDNFMLISIFGELHRYLLLDTLKFSSARKRMSVLVEDQEGIIWLLTKGADNKILERGSARADNTKLISMTNHLDRFASEGLRTLLLAKKKVSREAYQQYKQQIAKARGSLSNRKETVERIQEELEKDLDIFGATAIEDKLQPQIDQTISVILSC